MKFKQSDEQNQRIEQKYTKQSHSFQRLRVIMSDREFWVANSTRLQNRLIP